MNPPDISVVVVHHRGQEHLLESLSALEASSDGPAFETILVDNTAGHPMEEVLRRHPNVRRVAAGRNAGFAGGCRLGANAARAPLLAFVNDDAAVLPDAVAHLDAALSGAPRDVVAVAGRLVGVSSRKNNLSCGFPDLRRPRLPEGRRAAGRCAPRGIPRRGEALRLRRAHGGPEGRVPCFGWLR